MTQSNNVNISQETASQPHNDYENRSHNSFCNEALDQLKAQIDIVDIVSEHVELKKSGQGYMGLCPFHEEKSGSFSVNPSKNLYHCFGCQEGGDAIKFLMEIGKRSFQDVVAELGQRYGVPLTAEKGFSNDTPRQPRIKQPKRKAPQMPPPPKGEIKLARLAAPAADIPQAHKDFDSKRGDVIKTIYPYAQGENGHLRRWVVRTQWEDSTKSKGYSKEIHPWHRTDEGKPICKKGDLPWEAYRIDEAIAATKVEQGIAAPLVQEGEPCVELARGIGLASFTFQGGSWTKEAMLPEIQKFKAAAPNTPLPMLRDHDEAGKKKAQLFLECCAFAGVFGIVINPADLIRSGEGELPQGADIKEILGAMGSDEFIRRLEAEIHKAVDARRTTEEESCNEFIETPEGFNPKEEFLQEALDVLYGDKPWICVNNELRHWVDNHYKASLDVVELRRIRNFCNGYAVASKDGKSIRYPYANPSSVKKALEWIKISVGIDPKLTNPAGLNCTNGVLQIAWEGAKPSWELIPHNPDLYYTYEPKVTYKPGAGLVHCDRLLEALSEPEREIFLRTVAASLDLPKVRKFKGRMVRALLCKGDGSNGKDALKTLVHQMYGGVGLTGKTLSDFAAYDTGRKFPLAGLLNSRVNWSSENANTSQLDKIQSLKAFITGDTLSFEAKGKDELEYEPSAIALFNINDLPNLNGSLEAIQSRYAVLNFSKTFKIGADPNRGELEADPRFKYDPEFVSEQVLPAFLNRVLQALEDLMREGINYEPTRKTLEGIQAQNSHLFQFCQDIGLSYAPGSVVSVGEIWEKLRQWYLDSGTLTVEEGSNGKEKFVWIDQVSKRDGNVKGANQVLARFLQIFPKGKRVSLPNNRVGIEGIGFISQLGGEISQSISQSISQLPLQDKGYEPVKPVSITGEKIQENAVEEIVSLPAQPEKVVEEVKLTELANNPDTATFPASRVANQLPNQQPELANLAREDDNKPEAIPPDTVIKDEAGSQIFQVDDTVRVTVGEWAGQQGTIAKDYGDGTYQVNGETFTDWYYPNQLEPCQRS